MKWEYKTVNQQRVMTENDINKLGNDGWDLVGFQINTVIRNMQNANSDITFHYIFKRPKP